MVKVQIDLGRVEKAANEAFQEACLIAHREMIQVISEPGAFQGFPGDIVDTGALRASQQPPDFTGRGKAVFRNTVEYALYVYLGFTLRNGRSIDGRPWMSEALTRMDIQKTFETLLRSKL